MIETNAKEIQAVVFSEWEVIRTMVEEKTQFRSPIDPAPPENAASLEQKPETGLWIAADDSRREMKGWSQECPWGSSGDILWVKEEFRLPAWADDMSAQEWVERAAVQTCRYLSDGAKLGFNGVDVGRTVFGRERPADKMPREICRLLIEVEDIRAEPVQEITEAGAEKEGILYGEDAVGSARMAYRRRWKNLNRKEAWEENLWVWVVSFSVVKMKGYQKAPARNEML